MCLNPRYLLCLLTWPKANILIDNNGHAVLADFSLITLIPDRSTFLSTCLSGGTFHWMSPELLDPKRVGLDKPRVTRESDCYALGMAIYEVLCGCAPFGTGNSFVDLFGVLEGKRPERPQGETGRLFTDGIWDVVERCWKPEPSERAKVEDVLLVLQGEEAGVNDRLEAAANDFCMFSTSIQALFLLFSSYNGIAE